MFGGGGGGGGGRTESGRGRNEKDRPGESDANVKALVVPGIAVLIAVGAAVLAGVHLSKKGKTPPPSLGHNWPFVMADLTAYAAMVKLKQFEPADPDAYAAIGDALDHIIELSCHVNDPRVETQTLWHYNSYTWRTAIVNQLQKLSLSVREYLKGQVLREDEKQQRLRDYRNRLGDRPRYDPFYVPRKPQDRDTKEARRSGRDFAGVGAPAMRRTDIKPACDAIWELADAYHSNNLITLATRSRRYAREESRSQVNADEALPPGSSNYGRAASGDVGGGTGTGGSRATSPSDRPTSSHHSLG